MKPHSQLIVALDFDTLEKAEALVKLLIPTVRRFKVGSQLFTASGHRAIEMIARYGGEVFLDLKFHDIPQTVYSAVSSGTACSVNINGKVVFPVFMMTVHTQGGLKMLQEAVRGASEKSASLAIKKPLIVGVTVLTSDTNAANLQDEVLRRAQLAKDSGLDGVVCSGQEVELIRKDCGKEFLIVTPGIRPQSAALHDQKRVVTPEEAIRSGSDFLVVGRPILEAKDPLSVAAEIVSICSKIRQNE